MTGPEWLDELKARVTVKLPEVEAFRTDPKTLSLAVGTRGVTAHVDGAVVWIAPTFAAGGTLASRLVDRVQHLDPTLYGPDEAGLANAVSAATAHLKP